MPTVSVIMPVYNAEKYLRQAIDSILEQTFTDFELLLLNDGSNDGSEAIIQSYSDRRIIYLKNEKNRGLIFTLNRGIDEAKGEYIARMDADDIALPERLQLQINHLMQSEVAILATTVLPVDDQGIALSVWERDRQNLTPSQIRKILPKDNVLAHPTVMAKAAIFKKYMYHPELVVDYKFIHNQTYSEDYDLWLRVIADGGKIEKLSQPLLFYRVLPNSVTRFGNVNIFYRLSKVKFRFLKNQIAQGKISGFHVKIFFYACLDILKGLAKEIKKLFKRHTVS